MIKWRYFFIVVYTVSNLAGTFTTGIEVEHDSDDPKGLIQKILDVIIDEHEFNYDLRPSKTAIVFQNLTLTGKKVVL